MTKLQTGRRPTEGRRADQTAQHRSPTQPPVLPPRVVSVAAGPAQPKETRVQWGFRRALYSCRVLFYLVVPFALLGAIGIGVLYVRLSHGPIALDFVVAPIERNINAELTSGSIKIEGAELRLGQSGELEFRLRDVSVYEIGGDVVFSSPLAAVNISTAALLRARIVPSRIELIDPLIALAYSQQSGFVFERAIPRPVPVHPDAATSASPPPPLVAPPPKDALDGAHKVNLAKLLSDSSRRARKRLGATSYLSEFGISNATVIVDYEGQRSSWRIDEGSVDFDHASRRSVISGRATVASQRGPWAFSFLTDERENTDKLAVKVTVRDLVPSTLASAAPPLALLSMFEFPIAGDATVDLSTTGEIEHSDLALELGQGRMALPYLTQVTDVKAGLFKLTYDGRGRRWDLQPSPVKWAGGALMFTGSVADTAKPGDAPQWQFALDGKNGIFEAPEFKVPPVAIDTLKARGTVVPRQGLFDLAEFSIAGGGGQASIKASTQAGPQGQTSSAEVNLSPMPLATLKALWPRALATPARTWVGENVSAMNFKGGTLKFTKGEAAVDEGSASVPLPQHVSADFKMADMVFRPIDSMNNVEVGSAVLHLENNALEATSNDAALVLAGDRRLPLTTTRFYTADITLPKPTGEITVATSADLGPFIEAIGSLPVRAARELPPVPKSGEGKVDAQFDVTIPLVQGVSGDDIKIAGKAHISDGRFGKVAGRFDVQGFTLDLLLSDTALDAKGDLLINGIPAKIVGQRVLGAEEGNQPPLKILAKLDESDRTQLGLDVNDIVHGVVPVEVSFQRGEQPEPIVKVHADLTNAEIILEPLQWHKMPGRDAAIDADVVGGPNKPTELQNFKVVSDDITAEGRIGVGSDNKIREFEFPNLVLNVISKLDVRGTRDKDDIWSVKVKASDFDGRAWFRSLFNVGNGPDKKAKSANSAKGARVSAVITNVIGGSDVSLRNFTMQAETRNTNLVSLDAKGTLDGNAPLVASLDKTSSTRRLKVATSDAGQLLKLVGFYPNMQGGTMSLDVNLDGSGAAEKTGMLVVDDFKVLGDPIVSEVVSSADQGRPAIEGRQVTREVFEFDRMRAPFSVGYGQFVLEESYVKGPLLGANLRGKVDFRAKTVNIGGTYIPLQGLNGALGGIPLLGQILSGTQGEGIFGITFAVQGSTSDPQVIVNPLSLVAPGIFRDMFQMTSMDPRVQVREDQAPQAPVEKRVRSSSSDGLGQSDGQSPGKPNKPKAASKKKPKAQAEAVDGWSSTTTGPQ